MSIDPLADTITGAIASIEDVSSRIESAFVQVGKHLGCGQAIFQELNSGLDSLSQELSGTEIEGAAADLQDIAARLNSLAAALPSESALLDNIGNGAIETSSLLKLLIKQIQMITIIARSARIEAAAFDQDQGHFLDFTQEAFDLAKSVLVSIEGCTQDQKLLMDSIATALDRQRDFEKRYREQLLSVSADLTSAYSGMRDQRNKSVRLADLTSSSAKRIAETVGNSIVSLQAGDSTRQRLEHICGGLRLASGSEAGIVPNLADDTDVLRATPLICRLQADQLDDTVRLFDIDIDQIQRSLRALLADATGTVGHGRSLYGGQDGDAPSFLAIVKRTLARASALISTCESARKAVDDALSVVEDTLGKFRYAISGLSETVVDIILIGMNAGLKAGHLGTKGSAFVVIANELKATADHVSSGARLLKPVLDRIEGSANDLKNLRVDGDSSKLTTLEPSILHAIQGIEAGNDHLCQLMNRLVEEGAQFEDIVADAQALLSKLGESYAAVPDLVVRLRSAGELRGSLSADETGRVGAIFNELYARYTMVSERDVHLQFLAPSGLPHGLPTIAPQAVEDSPEDVLFF